MAPNTERGLASPLRHDEEETMGDSSRAGSFPTGGARDTTDAYEEGAEGALYFDGESCTLLVTKNTNLRQAGYGRHGK